MFFFFSMADKNIWMPHQLSYFLLRQKIMWNILGMEQLLKAKKRLLLALNTRKTLQSIITQYVSEPRNQSKSKLLSRLCNVIQLITSSFVVTLFFFPLQCIWGSYWKEGKWGYKCCHSFVKFSYCTGEAGKEIAVRFFLSSIRNINFYFF